MVGADRDPPLLLPSNLRRLRCVWLSIPRPLYAECGVGQPQLDVLVCTDRDILALVLERLVETKMDIPCCSNRKKGGYLLYNVLRQLLSCFFRLPKMNSAISTK